MDGCRCIRVTTDLLRIRFEKLISCSSRLEVDQAAIRNTLGSKVNQAFYSDLPIVLEEGHITLVAIDGYECR